MISDRDHDFRPNVCTFWLSRGGSVRLETLCMDLLDARGNVYRRMVVEHRISGDITPEEADELLHWAMCCGSSPLPAWCK